MNFDSEIPPSLLNRRDALRHLSAGALLALGWWPGRLRAADNGQGGSFRFMVINDTHYLTDQCGEYFQGVVQEMKQQRPEFCLHGGDVTDKGGARHFDALKAVFRGLGVSMYPVIGNHDYLTPTDRRPYLETFPLRLNYYFRHRGWQFLCLDSSEGQRYENTKIQPGTFRWLDEYLPRLSKTRPTILLTHFPLGADVKYRPANADALLDRLRDYNLVSVFNGHYHGFTERKAGGIVLTTNKCCSLQRGNHDGTKDKGYFVCTAVAGTIEREFVEHKSRVQLAPKTAADFSPAHVVNNPGNST